MPLIVDTFLLVYTFLFGLYFTFLANLSVKKNLRYKNKVGAFQPLAAADLVAIQSSARALINK